MIFIFTINESFCYYHLKISRAALEFIIIVFVIWLEIIFIDRNLTFYFLFPFYFYFFIFSCIYFSCLIQCEKMITWKPFSRSVFFFHTVFAPTRKFWFREKTRRRRCGFSAFTTHADIGGGGGDVTSNGLVPSSRPLCSGRERSLRSQLVIAVHVGDDKQKRSLNIYRWSRRR